MKIYNLGSLNIDYVYSVEDFVRPGETIASAELCINAGGKGLNQSVALARAGAKVIHGGAIGTDGEFLKELLKDSGADTAKIKTTSGKTGHAIIQVNKNGQNCIILYKGANQTITPEYIEDFLSDAQSGDILLLQNETNCIKEAMLTAHNKGMQIAFNPSPFEKSILDLPIELVDWWFLNEIEGEEISDKKEPYEIAEELLNRYPDSNIILTLGKNGCIFKNKDITFHQPIIESCVADTTAAGDTFTGYFLAHTANGKDAKESIFIATKASSIAVSRKGAAPSIPTIDEVI